MVSPPLALKNEGGTTVESDRHAPDNIIITIRARRDGIARPDAAAQAARESHMAYIRQAVEERMARESAQEPIKKR